MAREEKKERKVSIPILDLQMGNSEKIIEEEIEEGKRSLIFLFLTRGFSLAFILLIKKHFSSVSIERKVNS